MGKNRFEFNKQIVTVIVSVTILAFVYFFFFVIQYYQLPIGDDVLFQYKDSYYYYTKMENWHPTERISTLSMMVDEIWNRWHYFSGRFTTVFFVPVMSIVGQKVCAVVGAGIWLGIVFCIARVAFGSWKKIFLHPLELLFIFLYQFALSATGYAINMWTFVCHYGAPTLLCLLYYIYWMTIISKKKVLWREILILNFLGLILGASHELLPLFCFILVGVRSLIIFKDKEKKMFNLCYLHCGVICGYLFCILAPGNIVRLAIDHDSARTQTGIVEKMRQSIWAHVQASGLSEKKSILLALVGIFLLVICIKREGIKNYIRKNIEFICACFMSVLLWGLVAPVPQYGLELWKAMLIICFIRDINLYKETEKIYLWASVLVFGLCVYGNGMWCKDLISVTVQRRELIQEAYNNGEDQIMVPKYPNSTNNYMTCHNEANDTNRYYDDIYIEYYGILIIPEE